MEIRVNGKAHTLKEARPWSVEELLSELGIEAIRGVAVAVGDQVVPRSAWSEPRIEAGTSVEIIRATQGG
ncbi:thiamine biosynthesis protein ThiS [Lujinxingia litoralis]|uniref:Thiamine biosynthesis protein ThiS n=1 Tax=Lujinxingia litoralis TaxID=2211119 RepID=A0A328C345_9DELT|nr:sulfur carrier protein ThiS [Lujinxingia litoralis]RAL20221.1 thiamine biosynthesis protein ThiS [Lujinxingia litoralis]